MKDKIVFFFDLSVPFPFTFCLFASSSRGYISRWTHKDLKNFKMEPITENFRYDFFPLVLGGKLDLIQRSFFIQKNNEKKY